MLRIKELVAVDSLVSHKHTHHTVTCLRVLNVRQSVLIVFLVVPLPVLQVLQESKGLMRNTSRSALEQANERECEALKRVWGSSQGTDSILQYLQRRTELC